jgi:hypothetical protein
MKIIRAFAWAGFASFGLFSGPASANVIVNGNFDGLGAVTANGWALPGAPWVVSPGQEIADLTGADYIPCCGASGTPAELANHFASFGPGDQNNVSTLTQTFTLAGGVYALTFDAGAFGGGTQVLDADVYATGGAIPLASIAVTTVADNNLATIFNPYQLDFAATGGGSYYVSFNAVGPGVSIDPVLDNVAVNAVPEPATWAMMLLGFAGLGLAGYRKARKTSAVLAV